MQFIMPDSEGESWYFQEGRHFSTEKEPTALCRCGLSRSKPYCAIFAYKSARLLSPFRIFDIMVFR